MASVTMALKLVASFSWRVAILLQHLSQPMQRSTVLRRRYFLREKFSRG